MSPPGRRWRIPPGAWARSTRSTPQRSLIKDWSSSKRTCSSVSALTASRSSCTGSRWCTPWWSSPTGPRSPRPAPPTWGSRSRWAGAGPGRVAGAAPPIDWTAPHAWTFEPLDEDAFPAVALARQAGMAGGAAPAGYNAANEECVAAFLAGRIPFTGIVDTVTRVVSEHDGSGRDIAAIEDVLAADRWARARARELTGTVPRGGADAAGGTHGSGKAAG